MKHIYVLTLFCGRLSKMNQAHVAARVLDRSRTMGFYFSEEEAVRAIKKDACSMREYLFDYAVIEEVPDGVFVLPTKERWFHWTSDYDEAPVVEEIEKPKVLEHIVCFGMG